MVFVRSRCALWFPVFAVIVAPLAARAQVVTSYDTEVFAKTEWDALAPNGRTRSNTAANQSSNPLPYNLSANVNGIAGFNTSGSVSVSGNVIAGSYSMTTGTPVNPSYSQFISGVTFTANVPFTYFATSSASYNNAVGIYPFGLSVGLMTFGNSPSAGIFDRNRTATTGSGSWSTIDTVSPNITVKSKSGTFNGDNQVYAPGVYRWFMGSSISGTNSSATGNFTLTLTPLGGPPPIPPPAPRKIQLDKFNDINGNGVRDPGEPGMAGWNFTVFNVNQGTKTITTGEDGIATLEMPNGAPSTSYTVNETNQAGWTPTTLGQILTIPDSGTGVAEFGNQKTPELGKTKLQFLKFLDGNNNGLYDLNELGLPNWEINILKPDLSYTTLLTGSDGIAYLDVSANFGTYQAFQEINPGFLNVYSSNFAFNANGSGDVQSFQLATLVGVPEPGSLAVLALGLIPVIARRRTCRTMRA